MAHARLPDWLAYAWQHSSGHARTVLESLPDDIAVSPTPDEDAKINLARASGDKDAVTEAVAIINARRDAAQKALEAEFRGWQYHSAVDARIKAAVIALSMTR